MCTSVSVFSKLVSLSSTADRADFISSGSGEGSGEGEGCTGQLGSSSIIMTGTFSCSERERVGEKEEGIEVCGDLLLCNTAGVMT